MEDKFENIVKNYIKAIKFDNVLVHSDITFGFEVPFINRNMFIESHINKIIEITDNKKLFFPTFNYDFCKTGIYDLKNDKSKLGVISEYYRITFSEWRTKVPIFNFSGIGTMPDLNISNTYDPFGIDSLFGFLYKNNGLLLHYGSNFNTTTLIHYAERLSENLIYRYDKNFIGNVIFDTSIYKIELLYHVWPRNLDLKYDWRRIEDDLTTNHILYKFQHGKTIISFALITNIVNYWLKNLNSDPFYFLDDNSRILANNDFKKFKRKFLITDFE